MSEREKQNNDSQDARLFIAYQGLLMARGGVLITGDPPTCSIVVTNRTHKLTCTSLISGERVSSYFLL